VLRVGDRAPDFTAKTTAGRYLTLAELLGKYVVIYFFPKAFTPGCIKETTRFRDAYPDLKALGAEVIGVSVDDHETQCEFATAQNVGFPMIGDGEREISRLYGVLRTFLKLDKRVTYVIDREGAVRGVFQHEFQVSRHLDDVLHLLEGLVRDEVASGVRSRPRV
jgi:peroxiredoxin Q/BCP